VIEAAWTGQPVPWPLLRALICETFGWTFQELDEQPLDEVLQSIQLLNLYHEQIAKRARRER